MVLPADSHDATTSPPGVSTNDGPDGLPDASAPRAPLASVMSAQAASFQCAAWIDELALDGKSTQASTSARATP
jgi:hypothetical protein